MTKRSPALLNTESRDAEDSYDVSKRVCARADSNQNEIIVLNCEADDGKVSRVAISKSKLIQHSEFFKSKFSQRWTPQEGLVGDEMQLSVYNIEDFDPLAVKIVFEMLLKYDMIKNAMDDFGTLAEMFRCCDYFGIKLNSVIEAIENKVDSVPLTSTCVMSAMKAVVCLEKIEQFKQVATKLEDRVSNFIKTNLTTAKEVMTFVVYYNKDEYCQLVTRVLSNVNKLLPVQQQQPQAARKVESDDSSTDDDVPLAQPVPAGPRNRAPESDDSSTDDDLPAPQPAAVAIVPRNRAPESSSDDSDSSD